MKYEIKIKKLPKSEVEIEATVPAETLTQARKKAIELYSTTIEIDGFRKGHVPENVVLEKVGEAKIIEEAVDILLQEHFPKIIEQEKLDIIGRPKISITKIALGNPFEFKAAFAVMPDIELPDYKKIAASSKQQVASKEKKEDTEASEKEVADVLLQIRRNKAHFDWHEAHKDEKPARHASQGDAGGGHNHPDIKDDDLPELNDEFAQMAGNFKNLIELKEKVKQNIENEKKIRNTEKNRAAIMEALLKNTKIDLPDILVESEIEKSLAQMKDDVERMGAKFEDYLKETKKTTEEFKKDLRESAEKKASIQIILNKIAETEKIEPNFIKKLEEVHKNTFDFGQIKGVLSSSFRFGYRIEEKESWFAVDIFRNKFLAIDTAMHELMHFMFHKYFDHICKDKGLTENQMWDIKESFTVLLNIEFNEAIFEGEKAASLKIPEILKIVARLKQEGRL